ncbi:hypothetical protein ACFQ9X_16840 [Catenulispora yoronensis]
MIGALADWASVNDADRMYLQVEHENVGAVRIYGRFGFSELRPFYFRMKDTGGVGGAGGAGGTAAG